MQISVSGRHMRVSQDLQDYARSKASKLGQFFDKLQKIDVIVSKEGAGYAVEVIVKPDGHESLVGHDSAPEVKTCIDLVIDKLERQITRHKEKTRNHKHRQTGQPEVYLPE
ncbi:MAG: ribosome-associated translation inhibitor RaiA [Phycisphaerae bacterium]|nr:ribosome-associated translation inhibitor RaiA [Phycisphaerae bacterium]